MNADPFAAVRINKQPQQNIQKPQDNPKEEDPFASVRIKKADEKSGLYEVGRHAARIGSRIAETVGGIPGDVSSLIQSGVIAGMNKLTGHELSQEGHEEIRKQRLPTSGELKEFSEEKTGGFTSPQNEFEKFGDEAAEILTSLIGPMKFRKALGVAAGASLAKQGVKTLGLGEGAQEAAKLGTMLMITATNPRGAMNYASQQYQKANQLAKGASIQVTNFKGHLENMLKDLNKGIPTAPKNVVVKTIEDALSKVNKNKMLVEDLTAMKRDINTIMKDPSLLTREKKLLKGVAKEVDQAIVPYEKTNPAFSKAYRPANEIYGAVMQGTKAHDFITKYLGTKSVLGAALAEVALGHPEYALPTVAGYIGAKGAAKASDFFVRIAKSPELQKYYAKAIAAAASEDLSALRIYADKIEEEFNHPPSRTNKKK